MQNCKNDLLEIARQSWNSALLKAVSAGVLETRPLMVFQQRVIDDSGDASAQTVRERITHLLSNLAPFTYLIDSGEDTAAYCWLAVGNDFWVWGARSGTEVPSLETTIERAISVFKNKLGDGSSPSIYLHSLFVLSDTDQTEIGLSTVEEAVADMDGTALFFDANEGQVTFQNWWDGERDSGFLGAAEDGGDTEAYTLDPAPGREYLTEVMSTFADEALPMPRSAA